MIQAATYTSEEQMIASYKATRARLMGSGVKTRPANENAQVVKMEGKNTIVAPIKATQIPLWEFEPTHFTAHIIDYRRWQLAQELAGMGEQPREVRISMDAIVRKVLEDYPEFTMDMIKGERRMRKLVRVRQLAIYEVSLQRPDKSLPEIGRFFQRDHTTVLHAIRKMSVMRERGEI